MPRRAVEPRYRHYDVILVNRAVNRCEFAPVSFGRLGGFVGGDGGELNPPSRRRTAEIYYKLIRAFDLAS
jgi:hypothetical protein